MNRLWWEMMQFARLAGWQGGLGMLLLLAAGIMASSVIPAGIEQLGHSREEASTIAARLKSAGPGAKAEGPRDRLAAFYAFFPAANTVPDWLEQVYAVADSSGVRLETGEYKLVEERGHRLAAYQMTLPVRGSYRQVREFVAGVLENVPAASLDEIGFRRDSVGSPAVEARLRFTIYLGRSG